MELGVAVDEAVVNGSEAGSNDAGETPRTSSLLEQPAEDPIELSLAPLLLAPPSTPHHDFPLPVRPLPLFPNLLLPLHRRHIPLEPLALPTTLGFVDDGRLDAGLFDGREVGFLLGARVLEVETEERGLGRALESCWKGSAGEEREEQWTVPTCSLSMSQRKRGRYFIVQT